jgi:hypothetical protein
VGAAEAAASPDLAAALAYLAIAAGRVAAAAVSSARFCLYRTDTSSNASGDGFYFVVVGVGGGTSDKPA